MISGIRKRGRHSNFAKIREIIRKTAQILSQKKELRQLIGGGFYFGITALFLLGVPFFSFGSLASLDNLEISGIEMSNPFFKDTDNLKDNSLFFSQNSQLLRESPDLKIVQDSFVYGISTPRILTTQTLGNVLGEGSSGHSHGNEGEISDYTVESGDTMAKVAGKFGLTPTTIALANDLSVNSTLKVGSILTIPPVDGLLHDVKKDDTVSVLAQKYKAKIDDIISFNELANEADIFIGDVLFIPYGKIPPKAAHPRSVQVVLPDSFFIIPVEEGSRITQARHFRNAWDAANNCGTSIYAAASGTVQKARSDRRYGNYITILHSNGVVTYYGHVQAMLVKPGDNVVAGDRIATMGKTGIFATGCHLHFDVIGAVNPLSKYSLGAVLNYK